MPYTPEIPETIVVHLGAPDDTSAQNVSESFASYIKNVASSEIYPTWPTEAIKANIYAQISVAMNRVYTDYYRVRGYDFDITGSPAYDQTYIYQRDIFENISQIVDEIFDSYIRRVGQIEPLYAVFCDGVEVNCDGLKQWESVRLAEQGMNYLEILKYFYGDDIEIVSSVPVQNRPFSAPPTPLGRGDSGRDVELIQIRLNRISANYPGIPKINPQDGFFGVETENAVKKFQEVFNLTPDGIVGRATWNSIQQVYSAVKKLSQLNSEGVRLDDVDTRYPGELSRGSKGEGVLTVQYYLSYINLFVPTVTATAYDGDFGAGTESAVKSFQKTYNLPETGVVNRITFDKMEGVYSSLISSIDFQYSEGRTLPYPGRVLSRGSMGDDVRVLQEYLNFIARRYNQIPTVVPDGILGEATERQINAFKSAFNLPMGAPRVNAVLWNNITSVYDDLYNGAVVNTGQYPGSI
jgi:peptidoglycan hydrolase-like protein with peptidoglycan-binding domain